MKDAQGHGSDAKDGPAHQSGVEAVGTHTLSADQHAQIARMKASFPFRIAYGALNPKTGEFVASAVTSRCITNKLAREGWLVWTA